MGGSDLECALHVLPEDGGDIGLSFDVRNSGDEPADIAFFAPFLAFDLSVEAADGPVPVVQPAYDVRVQPRTERLAPGQAIRIETPVRLRFDPDVPPSGGGEPMRWSLARRPEPVRLRATMHLDGRTLRPCEARFDPGPGGP